MSTDKVKVAFIGNMNNNHFAVVRYLRDAGVVADLLLTNNELDHFHPRCDCYDTDYMAYTKELSWGGVRSFTSVSSGMICKDLEPYTFLVGTGLAPAYIHKARRRLDIFIPYGDDIWVLSRYRISPPHYLHQALSTTYYQRKGILNTKIINTGPKPKVKGGYEELIRKLAPKSSRWLEFLPMVYAPQYDAIPDLSLKTHWGEQFKAIRARSDLMIISVGRLNWSDRGYPSSKGTDTLIYGYNEFCKRNPSIKSTLVLLEYGLDVKRTRDLVQQLNLSSKIAWLPKMYRKDLMIGCFLSDVCCGQIGISWIQNGTLFEALVAGKPILATRNEDEFPNVELYPVYNANTRETIADRLEEYIANPEAGKEMGRIGRQWYEKEVVEKTLNKYLSYFKRAAEIGKHGRNGNP